MRSEAPPWLAPPWRRELALLLQGGVIAGGQLAPALLPEWPGNEQGLVKQWEENTVKLQVERAGARWRGRRLGGEGGGYLPWLPPSPSPSPSPEP